MTVMAVMLIMMATVMDIAIVMENVDGDDYGSFVNDVIMIFDGDGCDDVGSHSDEFYECRADGDGTSMITRQRLSA